MGSYIHDATQIFFTGTWGHDEEKQRAQQYELVITDLDPTDTSTIWANRTFSFTGFKVGCLENLIQGFFWNTSCSNFLERSLKNF